MFIIRTGFQGHGKTINSIIEIDKHAFTTGRTVYYHNVTGFNPGHAAIKAEWVPFEDPTRWFELPRNAIIVIDEAQTWFRVRPQGSQVPEFATRLEIMRKDGHELHCITQSPKLIDSHMRELCSSHIHYHRGNNGPIIKRWVFPKPELSVNNNKGSFSNGESSRITIDKTYFGCYESVKEGTEHHFKFRPPKALYTLIACVIVIGFLSYRFYVSRLAPQEPVHVDQVVNQPTGTVVSTVAGNAPVTPEQYVASRVPRVPDIPSSAPLYDQITAPVSYPKTFCISSSSEALLERAASRMVLGYHQGKLFGCRCNTQQGTKLDVSFEACMSYVENGAFDSAKPDSMVVAQQADGRVGPGEERAGTTRLDARSQQTQLVVVPDTERSSRPWRAK